MKMYYTFWTHSDIICSRLKIPPFFAPAPIFIIQHGTMEFASLYVSILTDTYCSSVDRFVSEVDFVQLEDENGDSRLLSSTVVYRSLALSSSCFANSSVSYFLLELNTK